MNSCISAVLSVLLSRYLRVGIVEMANVENQDSSVMKSTIIFGSSILLPLGFHGGYLVHLFMQSTS